MVEKILIDNNVNIFNERKPTHLHVQNGTLSSIDLALRSLDIAANFG